MWSLASELARGALFVENHRVFSADVRICGAGTSASMRNVLLVTAAARKYSSGTSDWDAVNVTSPVRCIVIRFPDTSMVATLELLLTYVIAPLLLLIGRVDI
jgi:hypothetical protein